jgi:hypothetical protein
MFEDFVGNPASDDSAPPQPHHSAPPRPACASSPRTWQGVGVQYGAVDATMRDEIDRSGRDESRDGAASAHQPRPPDKPRKTTVSPRAPDAIPGSSDLGSPPGLTAPQAPLARACKKEANDQSASATPAITAIAVVAERCSGAPAPVLSKRVDLVVVKEGSATGIPLLISGSAHKPSKPHAAGPVERPSPAGDELLSPWGGVPQNIAPRVSSTALHSRVGSFRTRPRSVRERATSPERLGTDVAQVG